MNDTGDSCVGDLEVRTHERILLARGQEIALTPCEFDIVATLAEHPGWVFSAGQLASIAEDGSHSPESVSVLVSRVRQKLAVAGVTDAIETVRGFGYRLHPPAGAAHESPIAATDSRGLRNSAWQLQEAVFEVEHSGTAEQQSAAAEALDHARRTIYALLAR